MSTDDIPKGFAEKANVCKLEHLTKKTPEAKLKAMTSEARLKAMTPRVRLRAMTPKDILKAMAKPLQVAPEHKRPSELSFGDS